MFRSNRRAVLMIVVTVMLSSVAARAETFEELNGRFLIDLPKGWASAPQQSPEAPLWTFSGNGATAMLALYTGDETVESVFKLGQENVRTSMPGGTIEGDVERGEIQGNPGQWSVQRAVFPTAGMKLEMTAFIGVVKMKEGVAQLNVIATPAVWKKLGPKVEAMFQSLRDGDAARTSGGVAAATAPAPSTPTEFVDNLVTFTVPAGFVRKTMPNQHPDIAGMWVSGDSGASVTVVRLKRVKKTRVLLDGMRAVIQGAIPEGSTIEGPTRFQEGDLDAMIETYAGKGVAEGRTVPLRGIMAATTADRCGVQIMSIVGADKADPAREEVLAILRSIH